MNTMPLHVIVPLHQPLYANTEQLEQSYLADYLPLLQCLEATPELQITLHFSGHLLDHLARRHEDFLLRIKKLVQQDRLEVLGGLFYGSFVSMLPELDVRSQIDMGREFWESFLGQAPQGFFLPELAWAPEIPALLHDTGLLYGVVSQHQVRADQGWPSTRACLPSVITTARGGHRVAAFVLDAEQSHALQHQTPAAWLQALHGERGPMSVWIKPRPHQRLADWLREFSRAMLDFPGQPFATLLPKTTWQTGLRACAASIGAAITPEAEPHSLQGDIITEWADFPRTYASIGILHKRMLHVSRKLRQAIAFMEDEDLEDTWNDVLATCQRLVFSAQSPDPYWLSQHTERSDPAHRHTAYARLIHADVLIDGLYDQHHAQVHGRKRKSEMPLRIESVDDDGDRCEELILSNAQMTAWIQHAEGPRVLSLEDRQSRTNVIDTLHPLGTEHMQHAGLRVWLVESHTSLSVLQARKAQDLLPGYPAWQVRQHDHQLHYHAQLAPWHIEYQIALSGSNPEIVFNHHIHLGSPADFAHPDAAAHNPSAWQWAYEIPLHLPHGLAAITCDGKTVEARDVQNTRDASTLQFTDKTGAGLDLHADQAVTLAFDHINSTVWIIAPIDKQHGRGQVRLGVRHARSEGQPSSAQVTAKKRSKKS